MEIEELIREAKLEPQAFCPTEEVTETGEVFPPESAMRNWSRSARAARACWRMNSAASDTKFLERITSRFMLGCGAAKPRNAISRAFRDSADDTLQRDKKWAPVRFVSRLAESSGRSSPGWSSTPPPPRVARACDKKSQTDIGRPHRGPDDSAWSGCDSTRRHPGADYN